MKNLFKIGLLAILLVAFTGCDAVLEGFYPHFAPDFDEWDGSEDFTIELAAALDESIEINQYIANGYELKYSIDGGSTKTVYGNYYNYGGNYWEIYLYISLPAGIYDVNVWVEVNANDSYEPGTDYGSNLTVKLPEDRDLFLYEQLN
jgi:hypothetical protein